MTNDLEKQIRTTYAQELEFIGGKTFEDKLNALLSDLTNHSESVWDNYSIRFETIMTTKEWENYVTHPERIPYKTQLPQLKNKTFNEIFDYIIELLKVAYPYYKSLDKSEFKEDLKKQINGLMECAFNARFIEEEMRNADAYSGRSEKNRNEGNIEVTQFSKNKYLNAIKEYCKYNGKNAKNLEEEILESCDNNLLKLSEVTATCDLEENFRRDLEGIGKILQRDLTLSFADFKRGWYVWKLFREIGINTDDYLELSGLPKQSLIEKRLLDFMKNEDFVEEMLKHMEDELPKTYEKYKKQGYVEMIDIKIENAQRKKYPKKLRKDTEIKKMIEDVKKEIYEYFPLAKISSSRNTIINPTHPAATMRAFNSSIKNKDKKLINTIVMSPRSDHKEDYLPTFAHETTHGLHRKILEMGETKGVLKKGTTESISTAVMEDFSQLVDYQFETDRDLPYTKQYKGKEFANFWAGFTTRFQVPFSLCQLNIRKEFDQMMDDGYTGEMTEELIWKFKYKYDELAKKWFSTGLNVVSKTLTAFGMFDSYNPRDGVVYMKRYMMKENEDTTAKEEMKMSDAFEKRWGKKWIESEDARIMVHWLLLETGRNENTHEYYKMILNKPIQECLNELANIGLNKGDIV